MRDVVLNSQIHETSEVPLFFLLLLDFSLVEKLYKLSDNVCLVLELKTGGFLLLKGTEEHPLQDAGLGSQHNLVTGELGPVLALQGEVREVSVLRDTVQHILRSQSRLLPDGME